VAGAVRLPPPRRSETWHRYFPIQYRLIRLVDPLARRWWRLAGLGNVVELRVRGRRTGLPRRVLLGLLRDDGAWYLGHPNGDVAWTRNLAAAGVAELAFRDGRVVEVRATRLDPGDARDRAIAATRQHVFPGNVAYRLAWPHIRAVGAFFVLVPTEPAPGA
jgi:deazaflavin-dependent oxidoreductase (nitroreductase family)